MKAILVKTSGNEASAIIEENVTRNESMDSVISGGIKDLEDIFTQKIDLTSTFGKKKCSRCFKLKRQAFHPIGDFSILLNGKPSSQCKVCRVEQSVEWAKKRQEHRREYQRNFVATRGYKYPTATKADRDARKLEKESMSDNPVVITYPDID